jgi:integrase
MPRQKMQQLKQRPDGRYACKYKGRFFYGSTAKEALQLRDLYIQQEAAGQLIRQRMTVRQYALSWLPVHKASVSPKCYNDYAVQLEKLFPLIGDKALSDVSVDDAAAVWNTFNGLSASTIKRARMLYVDLFDTAIENELCRKNPFKSRFAPPPKGTAGTHRALTEEEIRLIRTVPHRFQLPVLVMLYTGVRRGEALALVAPADVDLKKDVVHVTKAVRFVGNRPEIVDPKTEAGVRDIPILSTLRPFLLDRVGLIAPSAHGKLMTETAFTRAWDSYLHALSAAAGHPVSFRPHDLRHTYCTMLRDAGVDMKQAMAWMGHADEKMILRIYDHVRDARTRASVSRMEDFLAGSEDSGALSV